MSVPRNLLFSSVVAVLVALPVMSSGQNEQVEVIESGDIVQLQPDYPTRYTVVEGDTLWDISTRFLQTPWHWPRIWKINEQIANPHLIYPGDVIVLRFVDGQPELTVVREGQPTPVEPGEMPGEVPGEVPREMPLVEEDLPISEVLEGVAGAPNGTVVKLSPKVLSKPLAQPIPTISPEIILPFLTRSLFVEDDELEKAGYVTIGLDDRIALGDNSEFYARGLPEDADAEFYLIYRKGRKVKDPDTGKRLGYEAIYLGEAQMLKPGDPAKLTITKVKQEILPTDDLLVAPLRAPLPYYFPHVPETELNGTIVTALNAVSEVGPFTIVSINLGRRDGVEEGHVFRITRHAGKRKDPVTRRKYLLPDEESGLMMVFRPYEKLSYGLIINATQPVHILDRVRTP
jgi:LysM repeat protein